MKIQLDTNFKIIKLDESVNLGELQELLEKILPNNEWKNYKLETNTIINNWSNPIIIDRYPYNPYPYPWWGITQPYIVTNEVNYNQQDTFSNGVYNLSIN